MIEEIFGKADEILEFTGELIQVTEPEKYPNYRYGEINLDENSVRVFNEDDDGKVVSELKFKLEYKLTPIT